MALIDPREGYIGSDLGVSSAPLTPSFQRNCFKAMKYGFLISSLSSFNLEIDKVNITRKGRSMIRAMISPSLHTQVSEGSSAQE